jgi:hypothetical protein
MGFIHSKLRNSLNAKTIEKLVFIKSNMGAFYNCSMNDDYTRKNDSDHAGLDVTQNKTMVLIQIRFYSFKP